MKILESNVTIMVKDMDKSISFYQSVGLILKNRWANYYAQLTAPGVVIGLHPKKENDANNNSDNISIGFTVDDFADAKSCLDTLNINSQTRKEEGGDFLHFNDPDMTALYFIKPKW